jgi:hypothetical protein
MGSALGCKLSFHLHNGMMTGGMGSEGKHRISLFLHSAIFAFPVAWDEDRCGPG